MWQGKPNCVCGGQLEWLDKYEDHRQRLQTIKGTLRLSAPPKFNFLATRAKQAATDRGTIALSNRAVARLETMKHNDLILCSRILGPHVPTQKRLHPPQTQASRSLNRPLRRRTERRICEENQFIVGHLQRVRSVYNTHKWDEEHRRNVQLQRNMSQTSSTLSPHPNRHIEVAAAEQGHIRQQTTQDCLQCFEQAEDSRCNE